MGMYTELNIAAEIRDAPDVIEILRYMLGDKKDVPDSLPSHELFQTERWHFMLRADSYYFDGKTDSKLVKDDLYKDKPMYFLNVRCNLKNYGNEIELFLDWLSPFIKTDGFLGYKRYEECDYPTLIFCDNGNIRFE